MGLNRFAVVTALGTLCLPIAVVLVSTTESGLACLDWPLCEADSPGRKWYEQPRNSCSYAAAPQPARDGDAAGTWKAWNLKRSVTLLKSGRPIRIA